MKITDPLRLFELEWDRKISMLGDLTGPEGPSGRDGKDGREGKDGRDGRDGKDGKDAEVGTHIVDIRAVDKPYTFVVEYNTGETEEVTLEFDKSTGTYVDPTPITRKREVYITNAYYDDNGNLVLVKADGNIVLPPSGNNNTNFFIQDTCPDVDCPNLWIKTCSDGSVNLLLKV